MAYAEVGIIASFNDSDASRGASRFNDSDASSFSNSIVILECNIEGWTSYGTRQLAIGRAMAREARPPKWGPLRQQRREEQGVVRGAVQAVRAD